VIVTAHQPAYLPWLGLLHKAALADTFVILDTVQYERNSFTNRNRIRTAHGSQWLTVPVLSEGHMHSTVGALRIAAQHGWARKHWATLNMCYGRAPFFNEHGPFLQDVYSREWDLLVDLCEHILLYLFRAFDIGARVVRASIMQLSGKKTDLLLDLCAKTDAQTFIFGALGRQYAPVAALESAGVRAVFQEYHHPIYPQAYPGFAPGMNAFDLLMNVGPRSREVMMSGNQSRKALW
jgi:hypothetical protein